MGMTIDQMRHCFEYVEGVLFWRHSPARRVKAGDIAGAYSKNAGMHIINLRGVVSTRSKVVWALHHGVWPKCNLRHIDGNRLNDRIENLAPQSDVLKASPQLSNLPRAKSCNRASTPSHFGDSMGGQELFQLKTSWRASPESFFCESRVSHCGTPPATSHIVKCKHDHAL